MRNNILATLKPRDRELFEPHLREIELPDRYDIARLGDDIENVYFPHSGIVSFLVHLDDGGFLQTQMVGRDGVVGAAQALDDKRSINKIVVQIAGRASVIGRDVLRRIVAECPEVRHTFNAHVQFAMADLQRTAACNAVHTVEQRCARWLMRMRDLIGDEIEITQNELADMLAVRRTSVTETVQVLKRTGAIVSSRGEVCITDSKALQRSACECHNAVRRNYRELFGYAWPTASRSR